MAAHRAARAPMPGFGHDLHRPDDPRTPRLFALARTHDVAGAHVDAAIALSAAAAPYDPDPEVLATSEKS